MYKKMSGILKTDGGLGGGDGEPIEKMLSNGGGGIDRYFSGYYPQNPYNNDGYMDGMYYPTYNM